MGIKTIKVKIKLCDKKLNISRSEARQVFVGFERCNMIILDFDKVPMIGQGFADEIFRVYKSKHPDIKIIPINMNEAVNFMIERVEKPSN